MFSRRQYTSKVNFENDALKADEKSRETGKRILEYLLMKEKDIEKTKKPRIRKAFLFAPRAGFEPATNRLTADRSTTELPRNMSINRHKMDAKITHDCKNANSPRKFFPTRHATANRQLL